jgi:hypothetical protein
VNMGSSVISHTLLPRRSLCAPSITILHSYVLQLNFGALCFVLPFIWDKKAALIDIKWIEFFVNGGYPRTEPCPKGMDPYRDESEDGGTPGVVNAGDDPSSPAPLYS